MKIQMSALMDGELERGEAVNTIYALRSCTVTQKEWCTFHRIGAALRGEPEVQIDVLSKVMAALDTEPTVLAPQRMSLTDRIRQIPAIRPVLAMAASTAGVAFVAWIALSTGGADVDGRLDQTSLPVAADTAVILAKSKAKMTPRMQEYLVAHQAYAPGGEIVGGVRNIRTVSASSQNR